MRCEVVLGHVHMSESRDQDHHDLTKSMGLGAGGPLNCNHHQDSFSTINMARYTKDNHPPPPSWAIDESNNKSYLERPSM